MKAVIRPVQEGAKGTDLGTNLFSEARTMKVAFINQPWNQVVSPMESDSVAIWSHQVARRLSDFCNVTIYACSADTQTHAEHQEGIDYRYIPTSLDQRLLRLRNLSARLRRSTRPSFSGGLYYLAYILRVAQDLRRTKCDLVHIPNLSQFVPIVRAFNPGLKIVLHMHCEWLSQLDPKLIARRVRRTDLVVGCSEYITEKIRQRFPRYASRCRTVYNGVDVNRNAVPAEHHNGHPPRILFVGRISPEKGLHVLLEAFPRVAQRYPQAQLEIVGPNAATSPEFLCRLSDNPKVAGLAAFYHGDYLARLQGQLPAELMRQVSFLHAVPHSMLAQRYAAADVYVQSSLSEAFGMPVAEAMAASVPVVATRVGGIPELVEHGKTGLLVEADDAPGLAEAILRLLADEDLRKTLGQSARARVIERFCWDRIATDLRILYEKLGVNTCGCP